MARILLTTEGTYPYFPGGVSVWCDNLVREMHDFDYGVVAIASNPYVTSQFSLPQNVKDVHGIPLWGIRDPAENRKGLTFAELFMRKQQTSPRIVEQLFVPALAVYLNEMFSPTPDVASVGRAFSAMHRYFQTYDYQVTWRTEAVWNTFKRWALDGAAAGRLPDPSVHDLVQGLGWLYHFLMILDMPIPKGTELVHSSAAAFCGLVGVVAKLQYGLPYLLTEHGIYLREQYLAVGRSNMSPFSKRFLIAAVRTVVQVNYLYADRIAPVCAFNTRWEKALGAPQENIEVVYNGVSPDVFRPRERPHGNEPGRELSIVSVARSDPNKDLETLVRAAALVRGQVPAKFRVYGSITVPEYHERVLKLRKELGLEEYVEFAGHREDVSDVYREADILVQSSVSEAFPYALIEAMMTGAAIVATDVGGSSEAVGDAGIMVPARDPKRLADAIMTLARDASLRATLGEQARERALTLFNRATALRAYRRLYRGLMPRARQVRANSDPVTALARAFAFEKMGHPIAALDQLYRALRASPSRQASAAILAMIARLERQLNADNRATKRLVAAWLVSRLASRGPDAAA